MSKYYTPDISEFFVGFEYEVYVPEKEVWSKETFYLNDGHIKLIQYVDIQDDNTLRRIRVKYLDQQDIEDLGITKAVKSQWIGWEDYYSGNISGEYGYFLYYTLHFPRLYNKSNRVEDNLFKIILHRHYVSNEDETTNINDSLDRNESEIVYKGFIKNKSKLITLLKQLGINE